MKKWGVVPFPELLLSPHESLLSIQRYQQYPQCPVWFFIPERYKIWVDVRRIKQQNECFEVYRIPPRVKGKDGKTEAKSVYLFRKKDQHGHWVRWMSTIGKNGLMSWTHILLSAFLGYFGVQNLLHAATTARLFCQWKVELHSSVGRIHASLAVNYRRLSLITCPMFGQFESGKVL